MEIDLSTDEKIWQFADAIKAPFELRDEIWANRRKVRFREMEPELSRLPLNPAISDKALMVVQSELPNQEVHKRVKRLVANPPKFEVVVYDEDPEKQALGQELEDGVKAMWKWLNRGKVPFDVISTQFQQGDGLGWGKLDYLASHGSSLKELDPDELTILGDDEEDVDESSPSYRFTKKVKKYKEEDGQDDTNANRSAYSDLVDENLKKELPPFRLSAPDPLTMYYFEDGDQVSVTVERGKKLLHPLIEAFGAEGLRIENERLVLVSDGTEAIGGRTLPEEFDSGILGKEVNYIEIRTKEKIICAIEHPKVKEGAKGKDRGVILEYDNPFSPYSTGYVMIPGDISTHPNPAHMYQPTILGILSTAHSKNVLMTATLSAGLEAALSPKYIEVKDEENLPAPDEDKTPEAVEGREIPSVAGTIKKMESADIDLARAEERIMAEESQFRINENLTGDTSSSEVSGHRLAIQVGQADLQMGQYQNSRKAAIEELMKAILYAIKKRGLAVYIPTMPDGTSTKEGRKIGRKAKLTPEMADLEFELVVTLGSETPVTLYAKWQAMSQREAEGTLGYLTLMENSNVENPQDEIRRVFAGKALKATMEQVVPFLVQREMENVQARITQYMQQRQIQAQQAAGQGGGQVEGQVPPPGDLQMGTDPQTGMANGGGGAALGNPQDVVRQPGVNMPVVQSTNEYGPTVPEGV